MILRARQGRAGPRPKPQAPDQRKPNRALGTAAAFRATAHPAKRLFGVLCASAAAAALALSCAGCAAAGGEGGTAGADAGAAANAAASATRSFISMDTGMTLTVYAADQAAAEGAAAACEERVRALDGLLAPAGAESDLARLNAAEGAAVPVAGDVRALLDASLRVAKATGGAFDPTVYPVTSAWGFTTGDHRVPADDELAALLPRVGFAHAHVDDAAGTVTLDAGAQVDVGGVAKGFAADELRSLLAERGARSALLDLGGNVTAVGSKPDGSPWKVGVADPADPAQLAGALELRDATASTSGAYQRFFDDEAGRRWHHLIDPATGYPAESDLASVTVVGPDGARCDALSTALYVKGLEDALAWWRDGADAASFELVLVDATGTVHVTEGIAAAFTPGESYANRVEVARR